MPLPTGLNINADSQEEVSCDKCPTSSSTIHMQPTSQVPESGERKLERVLTEVVHALWMVKVLVDDLQRGTIEECCNVK